MNNREVYMDRSVSKVEVKGFEARHYDLLMNIVSFGTYPVFIRRSIREMQIKPDDRILIFGAGTGRNACLMRDYLTGKGAVTGLDIGDEMLAQAEEKCKKFDNVHFKKMRIDEPLPFKEEFDKVFISFVLHGFIQEDREKIIDNAYRALRPGGEFIILDYGEFNPAQSNPVVKFAFKLECPLATDFALRNWKDILKGKGFVGFREHPHFFGYVRLLAARK